MAETIPQIGRGTKIYISPLAEGDTAEPYYNPDRLLTFTTGGTAIAKGATSIAGTPALNAAGKIPKGAFLNFVSPTGNEVLVQLAASAAGGATSLTVEALPEAIAGASVATYPLFLKLRKTANLENNANTAETFSFETGGFGRSLKTLQTNTISLEGDYAQLDASYNTIRYFGREFLHVYFWIILPNPKPDVYSRGWMLKGVGDIGATPLNIPANELITAAITLNVQGKPIEDPPLPIVA